MWNGNGQGRGLRCEQLSTLPLRLALRGPCCAFRFDSPGTLQNCPKFRVRIRQDAPRSVCLYRSIPLQVGSMLAASLVTAAYDLRVKPGQKVSILGRHLDWQAREIF